MTNLQEEYQETINEANYWFREYVVETHCRAAKSTTDWYYGKIVDTDLPNSVVIEFGYEQEDIMSNVIPAGHTRRFPLNKVELWHSGMLDENDRTDAS